MKKISYNSYIESYCDVCGHGIYGACCEDNGLVFCCSSCKSLHEEDIESDRVWSETTGQASHASSIDKDPYKQFCFGCKNFKNLEPDTVRRGCWYNHVCTKSNDILSAKFWVENKEFKSCRETFNDCFHHREPKTVPVEVNRFELMDFN